MTSTGSKNNFASVTFPSQRQSAPKSTDLQQAHEPNIKVPEGSITEYTYMRYILYIRAKPGNLKCTHMPPSKQQYIMHECCKAVNELKAMTSVMSRYNFPFSSHSAYPHFQHFHISMVPFTWRPGLP